MKLSNYLMAAAAATMSVAPAMAAPTRANPAASLSVAKSVRAGTPGARQSKLAGERGGIIIALGIGVAIIIAIIVAGSEGSKLPTSP